MHRNPRHLNRNVFNKVLKRLKETSDVEAAVANCSPHPDRQWQNKVAVVSVARYTCPRVGWAQRARTNKSEATLTGSFTQLTWSALWSIMVIFLIFTRRRLPDQWLLSTGICWATTAWSVFMSERNINMDVCQLNTSKTEAIWCTTSRRQQQLSTTEVRVGVYYVTPSKYVRNLETLSTEM